MVTGMRKPMSVEGLTYEELADRLGTSAEAARSLVRRLRLPRKSGNDGKARVTIDLTEIQYKPLRTRPPGDHRADVDDLNARVEQLQGEVARLEVEKQCLEATAAGHRADFERERDRSDALMSETLKLTGIAMTAREKAARLEGQLSTTTGGRHHRWGRWFGVQARRPSPSRPALAGVSSSLQIAR
jgi:hypothetical protein